MKPGLQLKLSQQLTLTPQLQQSIRLLQLSTQDLQQELEQFMELNPLLERVDGFESGNGDESSYAEAGDSSATDSTNTEEWQAAGEALDELSWQQSSGSSDDDEEIPAGDQVEIHPSLREHLIAQLGEMHLSDRDKLLAFLVIESLDDDGFFASEWEELAAMCPEDWEEAVEEEEWRIALHHVQHFDPAGVGARNLSECLDLQLLRMPDSPMVKLARTIVTQHLDLLGARDYTKLKKRLTTNDDQLREAQSLISGLDPRPGRAFSEEKAAYIVPDVIVVKEKGQWVAHLNSDAVPKIRVNQMYANILGRQRGGDGKGLQEQLQEARWMIKNIQQRFTTILRVTRAIVARQAKFFEYGEVGMSPLVLREIADELDLHESTVSRVTNQKYMMTPRGIFELKYFFGSRLDTDTGGACSATAIRALIKQLIQAEDSNKPLSDSQLSDMLANQGVIVARRTVAKYREAMQIPPVNLRKAL